MLPAPAVTAQKHEAWRVAGESSEAGVVCQ